ncbi:MAG: carboxypeptidase-like regulatory domain-containing protein, partial [Bacteroidota bacterium]
MPLSLPPFIARIVAFACIISPSFSIVGQSFSGTVVDKKTQEPIAYVNIGVVGYNVGVISDEKGRFSINLGAVTNNEMLRFSILGYSPYQTEISTLVAGQNNIELEATNYALPQIKVSAGKKVTVNQFGCKKPSKTTTGQSGNKDFGFGGEWGVLIKKPTESYQLKDISFHTRFNTVDSSLFRIN